MLLQHIKHRVTYTYMRFYDNNDFVTGLALCSANKKNN